MCRESMGDIGTHERRGNWGESWCEWKWDFENIDALLWSLAWLVFEVYFCCCCWQWNLKSSHDKFYGRLSISLPYRADVALRIGWIGAQQTERELSARCSLFRWRSLIRLSCWGSKRQALVRLELFSLNRCNAKKSYFCPFVYFIFPINKDVCKNNCLTTWTGFLRNNALQWCCPQSDTEAIYCLIVPVFAKAHGICLQSLDTSPG